MAYWECNGSTIVGDFQPEKFRLLYWYVHRYRVMLLDADSWRLIRESSFAEPLLDPVLLDAHVRAEAVAAFREQRVPALVGGAGQEWNRLPAMITSADVVLESLEVNGRRPKILDRRACAAWVRTLNACAVDIALYNGISWERVAGPVDDGEEEPTGEAELMRDVVRWLLGVVDALTRAAGLSNDGPR